MAFDARNGPELAVPVSSFTIPDSMRAAVAQPGLTKLTLENITMDFAEYRRQLESSSSGARPDFPALAPSIHTLIMKDFLLGYPLGFLPALARQLPNLHNLTLAQQRFTGQSVETAREAEQFVNAINDLVELHLLDVFVPEGFMAALAAEQRRKPEGHALLILQADYTYRELPAPGNGGSSNYDPIQDALRRIPALELPGFITQDLSWLSFSMLPHTPDGILPYWYSATAPFVVALISESTAPKKLKVLKSTIFQFSMEDLRRVLARHPDLVVLRVTLRLEPIEEYLPTLWQVLSLCPGLQDVEIVGFPVPRRTGESSTQDILRAIYPTVEQMQALSQLCPDLNRFHANVLYSTKMGRASWDREPGQGDAEWKGGVDIPNRNA
ncbi:hypothetical protein VTN49DRAFT_6079 [Thermomyces lanuginosus]|uniref:uncharacterized protein n=1 Tax=Thermomyces lanuginosus TaxID=5541 RepID=UPI003741EF38